MGHVRRRAGMSREELCSHILDSSRKVDGPIPGSQCWLSYIKPNINGDTAVTHDGRRISLSRLVWEVHTGQTLARDMFVRRTCGGRRCIRPNHLTTKTSRSGKLTTRDIDAMRSMSASGGWTQRALGAEFGVSHPTVRRALTGKTGPSDRP